MSALESKVGTSGWSLETLKSHFDDLLAELDRRYQQRYEAQQQGVKDAMSAASLAVDKAEANAERWRQNANEWRGAMSDRDRMLMPRTEAEQRLSALDDKINSVTKVCVGATLLGIAVITVILLILRH